MPWTDRREQIEKVGRIKMAREAGEDSGKCCALEIKFKKCYEGWSRNLCFSKFDILDILGRQFLQIKKKGALI